MTPTRAAVVCLTLLLAACSGVPRITPYRIDVRQGNYVTQEMVAVLKPGMSKDQVRFALGTPLVADVFHGDRWDYIYRFQPGRGEAQQRRLTVFFEEGKLARVDGDVVPRGGEPVVTSAPAARVIEIGAPDAPKAITPAAVEPAPKATAQQ